MRFKTTIYLVTFSVLWACHAGLFAKDYTDSDRNLGSAMAQFANFEPLSTDNQTALFTEISKVASAMRKSINELSAGVLKDYLSEQVLFLEMTPQYQRSVSLETLKEGVIDIIDQLMKTVERHQELHEQEDLKNQLARLKELEPELKKNPAAFKKPVLHLGAVLDNALKLPLTMLFIKNPRDLTIYAQYLTSRGHSVYWIDALSLNGETDKFSGPESIEQLKEVIEKTATGPNAVAILTNASWIKNPSALQSIRNAHVILPVTTIDSQTLILPRPNLLWLLEIIKNVYPKEAELLTELSKLAFGIDASLSMGELLELIEKYIKAVLNQLSPDQKKLALKEEVRKHFGIRMDGFIDFIAGFLVSDIESKLLSDPRWFYKNFDNGFGNFSEHIDRNDESMVRLVSAEGEQSKKAALDVSARIRESVKSGKDAGEDALTAQNAMQVKLEKIKKHRIDAPLLVAGKKAEMDRFFESFKVQINELFAQAFSDINKEDLVNTQKLQETLDQKIATLKNSAKAKELKQLIETELSTLDSRIDSFKTIKAIYESEITQAIGTILSETAIGAVTGGPAGALKGAISGVVTVSMNKFLQHLMGV